MKVLELRFTTKDDKTATVKITNPRDNVTAEEITTAMQEILAADIFVTKTSSLQAIKAAQMVERHVTVYSVSNA